MIHIRLYLLSALLSITCLCAGQTTLRGKLQNMQQKEVARASITHTRTTEISMSDPRGLFLVNAVRVGDTLHITHLNFQDTLVVVNDINSFFEITLVDKALGLDIVEISTGYQHIPRERAVGSFETISVERLANIVSPNILDRLEGQSSILFDNVISRPSITLRGINTFAGNTSPLIILDNFPYEGDINSINPLDVESVTLLKDASAASIWGARASNGVIVIQSKKPQVGTQRKFNFSSSNQIIDKPDLYYRRQLDSRGMVELEQITFDLGLFNSYVNNPRQIVFSPVMDLLFKNREGVISDSFLATELARYSAIDNRQQYLDLMYRTALNQQYYLSMSESLEKSMYHISVGVDNNRGNLDEKFKRYSLRLNHYARLFPNLNWNNSIFINGQQHRNGHIGYPENNFFNRPYMNLVDEQGEEIPHYQVLREYADEMWANNSLLDWRMFPLREKDSDRTASLQLGTIASTELRWEMFKGLRLDLLYRFEGSKLDQDRLRGLDSYYTRDLINIFTTLTPTNPLRNIPVGEIKPIKRLEMCCGKRASPLSSAIRICRLGLII